jgi:vacuolar protein sorting-associated protein 35
LIDRLAAYAAREAENEDPEETKQQEEAAAKRLAEKVKTQKAKTRQNGGHQPSSPTSPTSELNNAWASPTSATVEISATVESSASTEQEKPSVPESPSAEPKGKEKGGSPVRKFRGVPETVRLFEVFWRQVVELVKVSALLKPVCFPCSFGLRPGQIYPFKTSPLFWSP